MKRIAAFLIFGLLVAGQALAQGLPPELIRYADMVVIGGDYLTMAAEKISKIPLVMTIIGGKIVFTNRKYAQELGPEHHPALHPALRSNP